ncbi:MAG: hypothetical protein ACWA44_00280 [Thiotrichales bacterium]
MIDIRHTNAFLLGVSAVLLISLIPGGPIENRDFSHHSPLILTSFNTFLTLLGMGSLLLIPVCLQGLRFAGTLSMTAGLSYFVVYIIDLVGLFPQTPSAMPLALFSIEVTGSLVALLLLWAGWHLRRSSEQNPQSTTPIPPWQTALLVFIGIALVIFATYSAMQSAA